MKRNPQKGIGIGLGLLAAFLLWTVLILCVDVRPVGQQGTDVGFAALNVWFHGLTGVHLSLYDLTDKLELLTFVVCLAFGLLGLIQMIRRRSLKRVDPDLLLLGAYYIVVLFIYLIFDKIPINYRPIPIDGVMETSYPSSTTLLVLSVMPTLKFQIDRRVGGKTIRKVTTVFVILFSAFIVLARLISGVHWLTDILGSVILSAVLYVLYTSLVALLDQRRAGAGFAAF